MSRLSQLLPRRWDPWLIPAALLALIPLLSLLRPGLPNTADGQVHLLRSLEVTELLRAGVFYPRWAADLYLGYGYPFFNFYAPGAHLLVGVIALSGLGVLRGMVAVQAVALLLYPVGAYLAGRSLYRAIWPAREVRPAALICAALYLYAPLRPFELFIQGNLSQLLALALLPWCAWALQESTLYLTEAVRRGSRRWMAVAGLGLAALVYAHHPSAFLAFPQLGLYALALALIAGRGLRSPRTWQGAATAAGAFALGIALSAAFWLPSVVELRDVNIAAIETGMFNVRLNLVPLGELLSPALVLDDAALNPPWPHSLGLAQVILAGLGALGAVAGLWRRFAPAAAPRPMKTRPGFEALAGWLVDGRNRLKPLVQSGRRRFSGQTDEVSRPKPPAALFSLVLTVLLVGCLALMLPAAAPLWEHLPLARLIAFPWRLLGPALLWAALLGGFALLSLPGRLRTPALAFLLLLIPLSVATYLFPRPFAPATEPTLADLARYELTGGARGTASANEYLPRWVLDPDPPPVLAEDYLAGRFPDRLDRDALPPGSRASTALQGPLTDVYALDLPVAGTARVRRFYFPGWRAYVDGQPVAIVPGAPYGLIEVAVPAGQHELRLAFESTPSRMAGAGLALAGLVAAAWLASRGKMGGPVADGERSAEISWRPFLAAVLVILVMVGAKALWVEPHTRWFRRSSPVAAPATMQHPVHARFANGIELIGYDLPRDTVRQDEALAVRLYWRALESQQKDVRPFLHLDALTGEVTWANQTRLHAGDKPSSGWPVGFYVVDDYQLAIPAETPPVAGLLRVGLLDEKGKQVPLLAGGDQATLGRVHVRERRPVQVEVPPGFPGPYRFGPAIRLLGYSAVVSGTPPTLELTLYWQANAPVNQDYMVFVHVLDSHDHRIAQGDGPPWRGWYPTTAWVPGQVIADRRSVALPAETDPAGVRIAIGLYELADGTRLPALDAAGVRQTDDQVVLHPLP